MKTVTSRRTSRRVDDLPRELGHPDTYVLPARPPRWARGREVPPMLITAISEAVTHTDDAFTRRIDRSAQSYTVTASGTYVKKDGKLGERHDSVSWRGMDEVPEPLRKYLRGPEYLDGLTAAELDAENAEA